MDLPLHDWLMDNIRQQGTGTDFGIIVWLLWKQRNEEVMEGKNSSKDGLIDRIQAWFYIVEQAKRRRVQGDGEGDGKSAGQQAGYREVRMQKALKLYGENSWGNYRWELSSLSIILPLSISQRSIPLHPCLRHVSLASAISRRFVPKRKKPNIARKFRHALYMFAKCNLCGSFVEELSFIVLEMGIWQLPLVSFKLWILCISLSSQNSVSGVEVVSNVTDRLALLDLKAGLVDGPYGTLSSWNLSLHFCQWPGVVCGSGDGRVTALWLDSLALGGSISPSIGNLSYLSEIQLAGNNLKGTLPKEIGRLSRIQVLNLTKNSLTGEIPVELTNCSNLESISLSYNNFVGGLPSQFGYLSKLSRLVISNNNITGVIPQSIGNLSSLVGLSVFSNNLWGSIPDLSELKDLSTLSLFQNRLSGTLPSSICNLSSLEVLSVSFNSFSGQLLSNLGLCFPKLWWISVGYCQFSGALPPTLINMSSLENFHAGSNFLTGGLPDNLGVLQNLNLLNVEDNWLGGGADDFSFLSSFSNATKLDALSLAGQLRELIALRLDANSLTGSLPSDVGELGKLGHFDRKKLFPWKLTYISQQLERNPVSKPLSQQFVKQHSGRTAGASVHGALESVIQPVRGQVPRKGVFANATAFSIAGNRGLCGGILLLDLPACANRNIKVAKKLKLPLKWIVAVTVSCTLCIVLIAIIDIIFSRQRNKNQKADLSQPFGASKFSMVSYRELFDATDGFAHCNLIGTGQFGCVYRGFLSEDDVSVAVKVMNLQQHGASRSFTAECEALRTVRHRNLVKLVTACSSIDNNGNDFKAFVLQLMPKGSLESWLHNPLHENGDDGKSGCLNLSRRLDIAIDVAHALEYLHHDCETPIVHCDLKPGNVLLDDDLVAHVSDFGLAKLFPGDGGMDSISSSVVSGTIGYVAPEYGLGSSVTPEGDIYSYGVLLLEMVTGKKPTDEMFIDSFSLHKYCKMALPDDIQGIADPFLFEESYEERHINKYRLSCLVSLIQIGVKCSAELPGDRMKIKDVVMELGGIKATIASSNRRPKLHKSMFQGEANDEVLKTCLLISVT
ncbi:unnamed protein product [Linum tenue]|uniref:non-specific serine/threonine protein kinase n=1 Tax=Linum tenue TaxID=586396 RepID=A0AAV0MBR2_9ROSI|nr:unnamed protein product [Linum tenue]